jgi:hypothetical protein
LSRLIVGEADRSQPTAAQLLQLGEPKQWRRHQRGSILAYTGVNNLGQAAGDRANVLAGDLADWRFSEEAAPVRRAKREITVGVA